MYETELSEEEANEQKVKKGLSKASRVIYDIAETLVIALAIVVFIYLFIASPHEVIGRSMEDNFFDGEYLLADKISYFVGDPKRGDVVIFKHSDTQDYIKRVIGFPGDKIEIRDGYVFVNGDKLDESNYLDKNVYTDGGRELAEGEVYTVPKDTYFVLGDNRGASSDSRSFGAIDQNTVKGRAVLVYWPFSHLKVVKRQDYNID